MTGRALSIVAGGLLSAGCTWIGPVAEGTADTGAPGTPTTPDIVAPRAGALGGCTFAIDRTEAGEPYATYEGIYDANGDLSSQVAAYADGSSATWTYDYSAPGERTFKRYDAEGEDFDYIHHYRWEDGLQVHFGEDLGADGTIERSYTTTHDEWRRWSSKHWDTDGDGEVDAEVTFAWAEDGDGWAGDGLGVWASGNTWTETLAADASAWVYRYAYESDTFYSTWEHSPRNALGYSAHTEDYEEAPGESSASDVVDYGFDELGRIASYARVYETWDAEEGVSIRRFEATYDYDCPEG